MATAKPVPSSKLVALDEQEVTLINQDDVKCTEADEVMNQPITIQLVILANQIIGLNWANYGSQLSYESYQF